MPDGLEATIRKHPRDFVVDELPAYKSSGQGQHLFVTFRKTGLTTPDAIDAIARRLEVDSRDAGHAGMKDRHAVTTQTASFLVPMGRDVESILAGATLPGIEILSVSRHENKLKPGHLEGNRFTLTLRDLRGAPSLFRQRFEAIASVGVPNAFGRQRFGRDGDNPERALAWLSGKDRGPRDRRQQRFLFSALQSWMFNEVLARREADGTWASILPGDLAKKHDSGGLFPVPLEGPELADAQARAEAGAISPTGPMFGARMRWPEGVPQAIERDVLAERMPDPSRLEAFRHLGEGTRRALRLEVHDLTVGTASSESAQPSTQNVEPLDGAVRPDPGQHRDPVADLTGASERGQRECGLVVSFVLPKGGYATTVLTRVCRVVDFMLADGRQHRENTGEEP